MGEDGGVTRPSPRPSSPLPTVLLSVLLLGTMLGALLAPTSTAAAPSSPRAGDERIDYVAMGDSYSAASGVLPVATDAPLQCLRSTRNYPAVIARVTGAVLTDVTCGGAQSKHYFSRFYPQTPPQLAALSARTDLVTMTIGGNNNGVFIGSIRDCAVAGLSAGYQGRPCTDQHQAAYLRTVRTRTFPQLVKAFRAVRAAAPNATIAVLGYPWITPERGSCVGLPIAPGDFPFLHRLQRVLNDTIERATRRARDLTFVDFSRVSRGRDACAPVTRRWIEPVVGTTNPVVVHPNARGEAAMARHALDVLGLDDGVVITAPPLRR